MIKKKKKILDPQLGQINPRDCGGIGLAGFLVLVAESVLTTLSARSTILARRPYIIKRDRAVGSQVCLRSH